MMRETYTTRVLRGEVRVGRARARVVLRRVDMVCLTLRTKTRWPVVVAFGSEETVPQVRLGTGPNSSKASRKRSGATVVELSTFAGWTVFAACGAEREVRVVLVDEGFGR
jgi:hypothetical protein